MAVKIEQTVDGHNHDILQQGISDVYGIMEIFFLLVNLLR